MNRGRVQPASLFSRRCGAFRAGGTRTISRTIREIAPFVSRGTDAGSAIQQLVDLVLIQRIDGPVDDAPQDAHMLVQGLADTLCLEFELVSLTGGNYRLEWGGTTNDQ